MDRHWIDKARKGLRHGAPRLAALLLAAALVGGCGQKGPLWVPGHAKNTPWPMKPAGTAADGTAPAPPATGPQGPPKDDAGKTPRGPQ